MTTYQERQEAKRERYEARAAKAEREAEARFNSHANETLRGMMGEPIKVGHHSEGRHRRLIDRAWKDMEKGAEAMDRAKHYQRKAAAVGRGGISSDDPDAVDKLREKMAGLEARQAAMKAGNRAWTKAGKPMPNEVEKWGPIFEAAGIPEQQQADILRSLGIVWQGRPWPSYALANNNANIRRVKERISALESAIDRESSEEEVAGVTVERDADENRIRLHFPGKPDQETRTRLKRFGFRWSRYNSAWQRHLNNAGEGAVQGFLKWYSIRMSHADA